MKKIFLTLIFIIYYISLNAQVEFPNTLSNEEKLYRLGVVFSEVKQNFVNFDILTFNWDSLYRSSIQEVLNTENDWDYYRVLTKMVASLNDGHTEMVALLPFVDFCDYPKVNIIRLNEKYYISWTKSSLSDTIEIGSEVIKINNLSVDVYLKDNIFPYVNSSTEKSRWNEAINRTFWGKKDLPYIITIKRKKDGKILTLSLPRNGEASRDDKGDLAIEIPRKPWLPIELSWMKDSIAVIAFNTFNERQLDFNMVDSIIESSLKANGLIIDLRKNGGGSTTVALNLLKHIIKDNFFLTYGWETRINDAVRKAQGYGYDKYKDYYNNVAYRIEQPDSIFISDTVKRFEMPIIILIGQNTYSAAEDFLMMLYEIKNRPLFIGEETGGSTGAPLVIPFESGVYVRICTRRQFFPYSKKRFVGQGIVPDINIVPTIDDLIEGRDVVLERALFELKKYID